MKPAYKGIVQLAISFILVLSAGSLFAQPYTLDPNGNGTQYVFFNPQPLPFALAADPTRGITGPPVLIYYLGEPVYSGDLAFMNGSTIDDLLRFYTPPGSRSSEVIFYSQANGTLAGTGIPFSASPVEISETGADTLWRPNPPQPGAGNGIFPVFDIFQYSVITSVPEPTSLSLLLTAAGFWLIKPASGSLRKVFKSGLRRSL